MNKNVHDKRPYYDRRIEPLIDPEWEEAINKKEPELYYWVEMYGGGRCIKKYKPSVAKLLSKRSGLKTTLVHQWISRERREE